MLWFILFGSLGLIIGITGFGYMIDKEWWAEGVVVGFLVGVVTGGVLGLIANALAMIWIHPVWYKSCDVPLQSMGTSSSISGAFFLGIGSVDSYPTYNYFAKTGPNEYQEGYQYTDSSTVHESNDTPHLTCWAQKTPNAWLGLLSDGNGEHYDFYIPQGSVIKTYTLKP